MIAIGDHQNQNCHTNVQHQSKQTERQSFNRVTEESQISQRINNFKISIRNRQINEYKNRIRKEMLSIKLLEEMVQNMPTDSKSTYSWAFELSQIYSQAAKYILTPDKVVQLFRLVQKFPNQLTLQLLEIIIYKSDSQTIDSMFQYDVMKLLHSFLNFSNAVSNKRLNKLENQSQGDEVLQEIVVINQAVKKVADNSNLCEYDENYQQKVEIVRTVLRVISELCRKKSHIRNFAILNHKSYTYCLKSYKNFHKDVEIQFIAFLQSVTAYPFSRNEEQFDRVINKIFRFFFNQKIELKIQILHEKTNRNYLVSYEYLIMGMTNLLNMKCSWILQKIFGYQDEKQQLQILNIVLNLINQCNYVFAYPTIDQLKGDLLPNKLFKLIVELIIHLIDALQTMPIAVSKKHYIHLALIQFLRKGKVIMNSQYLSVARRGVYFILSNYFYNNLSENFIHQLLIFDYNNHQDNFIYLIANLIQIETEYDNKLQIYHLINSIFLNIPFHIIEPLLVSSELLAVIIEKLFEETSLNRSEYVEQSSTKCWLLRLIHIFFIKLDEQSKEKFMQYREMMLGMYKNRLQHMIINEWTNDTLCDLANNFLNYLSGSGMDN